MRPLTVPALPPTTAVAVRFVANSARFIANVFPFLAGPVLSVSFVVISCVVWPTRCGVGHTFFPRTGNGLLA
jgi:hypothetical protein